jgi:hypothetical protein
MNLLERMQRFWKGGSPDDHPLSLQERHEHHGAIAYDAVADEAEHFVRRDFDPDEPAAGWLD